MEDRIIANLLDQVDYLKAQNNELLGDTLLLLGGYTSAVPWASADSSNGIFAVRLNTSTGALTKVQGPISAGINPCFLAAAGNAVYSSEEKISDTGKLNAFSFDSTSLQMKYINSGNFVSAVLLRYFICYLLLS
jgi:6-phosphogluconolactonase (cycloisomerase 2 family)